MTLKEKIPEKFLTEIERKNPREKILELSDYSLCVNCTGRHFAMIGTGMSNKERGELLIKFTKNKFGISLKKTGECYLCNNFFDNAIKKVVENSVKKLKEVEFKTFLVGSIIPNDMAKREEEIWEKTGIQDVERLKTEINREVGKKIEKAVRKKFDRKNPDVLVLVNAESHSARLQLKSLYVYGKYQKLARGIPQTKWICSRCNGKGCTYCKGEGKLYKTSVQEIIEKPLLAAAKSNKSAFHGSGREDIDARNLGWRPFVIEIVKPVKRKIGLKKIGKRINKSKKVKVKSLKFVEKDVIRKIKTEKIDKTYLAEVEFENKIDKSKLKFLKSLATEPILQKTPLRVVHRRADKFRKRLVKKISWEVLGKKKMQLKVAAESGLYIKELVSGDEGRTKPSVAEILDNKVKKISLDVIKIG